MITEKWLKEELDKIDDRIYWEIEGCGNINHVVNVFNKYLETQVKLCNKPAVSNNGTRTYILNNGMGTITEREIIQNPEKKVAVYSTCGCGGNLRPTEDGLVCDVCG